MAEKKRFQFSFASEDFKDLARFMAAVSDGGFFFHLLDRTTTKDWKEKWRRQLDDSVGVVVLFTDIYREKLAAGTAVAWESLQIEEVLRKNPEFLFFALDPNKVGQAEDKLQLSLMIGTQEINKETWIDHVSKFRPKVSHQTVSMGRMGVTQRCNGNCLFFSLHV